MIPGYCYVVRRMPLPFLRSTYRPQTVGWRRFTETPLLFTLELIILPGKTFPQYFRVNPQPGG